MHLVVGKPYAQTVLEAMTQPAGTNKMHSGCGRRLSGPGLLVAGRWSVVAVHWHD
jgi:hypothetical protein